MTDREKVAKWQRNLRKLFTTWGDECADYLALLAEKPEPVGQVKEIDESGEFTVMMSGPVEEPEPGDWVYTAPPREPEPVGWIHENDVPLGNAWSKATVIYRDDQTERTTFNGKTIKLYTTPQEAR